MDILIRPQLSSHPLKGALFAPQCVNYCGNDGLVKCSSPSFSLLHSLFFPRSSSVEELQPYLPLSLCSVKSWALTVDLFLPIKHNITCCLEGYVNACEYAALHPAKFTKKCFLFLSETFLFLSAGKPGNFHQLEFTSSAVFCDYIKCITKAFAVMTYSDNEWHLWGESKGESHFQKIDGKPIQSSW